MYKYGDKGPGLRTEGSAQVTRSPQPPSETGSASSQDEATRLSPSALPDGGLPKRLALMPEVRCENYLLGGPITWGQALSVGHRGRKVNELHHQCPLPPGGHLPAQTRRGQAGRLRASKFEYLSARLPPRVVLAIRKHSEIPFSQVRPRNLLRAAKTPSGEHCATRKTLSPGPRVPILDVSETTEFSRKTLAPGSG